jgi:hypothetical protein
MFGTSTAPFWRGLSRIALLATLATAGSAQAQLRVVSWNITNYGGGRTADIQAVVYGTFENRSLAPDAILVQEFLNQTAVNAFLLALNSAPCSPGDWAAAPFSNGHDTDNAFFYRTSKLTLTGTHIVSVGSSSSAHHPRDLNRYDVKLNGYSSGNHRVAMYSSHMKAGNTSTDRSRRLVEAIKAREDAQQLPDGFYFLLGGDLNLNTSTEEAYVKLTGFEEDNRGRFFDPISSPGSWENNSAFRFIHTQDPATTAGMNSRYDFILLCHALIDGKGFTYIGNPSLPYSTTTWNDPFHSYRAWGNDGSTFRAPLDPATNAMVGPDIAQAIKNTATINGGHVPIMLDLRVPPEIGTTTGSINLGTVVQGDQVSTTFQVFNSVDPALWGAGIAHLEYGLSADGGFSAPWGSFFDAAGGGVNSHTLSLDTTTAGQKTGTLTISSPIPGVLDRTISLTANVIPASISPSSYTLFRGVLLSGGLPQLIDSDNQRLAFGPGIVLNRTESPAQIVVESTSPIEGVGELTFTVEGGATAAGLNQTIQLFNFQTNAYEDLDTRAASVGDSVVTRTPAGDPNRFIQPGTRKMRTRVVYALANAAPRSWRIEVDQVKWSVRPNQLGRRR